MKQLKLLPILLLGLMLVSCKKDPTKQWDNFYGYTKADIVGTYSYSNIDGVFNDVEGTGRHACPDADVAISDYGGQSVQFDIKCPSNEFERQYLGRTKKTDNDFLIQMTSGYKPAGNGRLKAYNVTAYVMKNANQQVRLHGYAAVNTYKIVNPIPDSDVTDTIMDNGEYYYFDVIKN